MLLQEITIPEIMKATKQEFKSDREQTSSSVRIISKKFTPSYKEGNLTCVATTSSTTNRYTTKIQIDDVIFDDAENSISVMGSDNRPITLLPCDLNRTSVKMVCNCLDFYQRMSSYNKKQDLLIGQDIPQHYDSPTTPGNKAKGNPNNSIGMCKHLIALYLDLKQEGIFVL